METIQGNIQDIRPTRVREPKASPANVTHGCWVLFWANLGLAALKLTVGGMGYSCLLIVDGLHSGANAVMVVVMLLGWQLSHQVTVSDRHPYGLGKSQFVIALLVGFSLAGGAIIVALTSIRTLLVPVSLEPTGVVLAVALISIAANFLLVRYIKHTILQISSRHLSRMTRLQWLNILASAVVIQSVITGGIFGLHFFERVGSLVISLIVLGLSVRMIQFGLDGIMDRALHEEEVSEIKNLARSVEKVQEVKWVRTRHVGQKVCVDLCVGLDGDLAVGEVDGVSDRITQILTSNLEDILHVSVDYYPV